MSGRVPLARRSCGAFTGVGPLTPSFKSELAVFRVVVSWPCAETFLWLPAEPLTALWGSVQGVFDFVSTRRAAAV